MASRKSQTAIEAALLIGFLLFVFSAFVIAMNTRLDSVVKDKNAMLLKSVNALIKSEVDMATRAQDGYRRNFELPQKLEGLNYNISLHNAEEIGGGFSELSTMFVNNTGVSGDDVLFLPPKINGAPIRGNNTIARQKGYICFNRVVCP
jgi:hypothetical protein